MQVSKQSVKQEIKQQILEILSQVVADIKKPDEAHKFLQSFFTEVEIITIAKRLAIAHFLTQGFSYEKIKEKLKVSSATIANIQSKLNQDNGIKIAVQKIQADQWAEKWTNTLLKLFGIKPANS